MKKFLTTAVILAACTLTLTAQNATTTPSAIGTEIAVAAPAPTIAATDYSSSYDAAMSQTAPTSHAQYQKASKEYPFRPVSRVALGAGVDFLNGIDFIAATNVTRWMNLRVTGHYLSYTYGSGITESDITIKPSINLRSVQISADLLPFPKHSNFHISPGILFAADNNVNANINLAAGTKMSFDGTDYYASSTNPVSGSFKVNLSPNTTAATIGIGFGNLLPRKGSHWSVPFDIAAAFPGAPTSAYKLQGGFCQGSPNCATPILIGSNTTAAQTLQSNINKEQQNINSDLNLLQAYPIVSIGLAYNFKIR